MSTSGRYHEYIGGCSVHVTVRIHCMGITSFDFSNCVEERGEFENYDDVIFEQ